MPKLLSLALLIIFFFPAGCALFKEPGALTSIGKAKEKICLNSEGKGRFIFQGQKHVFSYQSSFSEEDLRWSVIIDFPIYGREFIDLEWDSLRRKAKTAASYEQALLKNSQNVNPAILDAAMKMWIQFFEDTLYSKNLIRSDKNQKISWNIQDRELTGKFDVETYQAQVKFLNPVPEKHFGRFDFSLSSKNSPLFGMELIVRNCLEKTE